MLRAATAAYPASASAVPRASAPLHRRIGSQADGPAADSRRPRAGDEAVCEGLMLAATSRAGMVFADGRTPHPVPARPGVHGSAWRGRLRLRVHRLVAHVELLLRLDPDVTHHSLTGLTSGRIAPLLRTALEKLPEEEEREIGKRFAVLVERRNDMIHAHPATAADGAQRLNRWAPHKARFGLVSDAILREFIADVEALNSDANAVRAFVKSQGTDCT